MVVYNFIGHYLYTFDKPEKQFYLCNTYMLGSNTGTVIFVEIFTFLYISQVK